MTGTNTADAGRLSGMVAADDVFDLADGDFVADKFFRFDLDQQLRLEIALPVHAVYLGQTLKLGF